MNSKQFTDEGMDRYIVPTLCCLPIKIEQGYDISGSASIDDGDNEMGDY